MLSGIGGGGGVGHGGQRGLHGRCPPGGVLAHSAAGGGGGHDLAGGLVHAIPKNDLTNIGVTFKAHAARIHGEDVAAGNHRCVLMFQRGGVAPEAAFGDCLAAAAVAVICRIHPEGACDGRPSICLKFGNRAQTGISGPTEIISEYNRCLARGAKRQRCEQPATEFCHFS